MKVFAKSLAVVVISGFILLLLDAPLWAAIIGSWVYSTYIEVIRK